MDHNKIGEKVRKIRKKQLKQTIEEFAEEIGVSTDTISRLENATAKVNNIEVFIRISEVFRMILFNIFMCSNLVVSYSCIISEYSFWLI